MYVLFTAMLDNRDFAIKLVDHFAHNCDKTYTNICESLQAKAFVLRKTKSMRINISWKLIDILFRFLWENGCLWPNFVRDAKSKS